MQRPMIDRAWVAPVFLAAVVTAVLLPSQPWSHAVGHPTSDLGDHLQGIWWFGGEILEGRWPLRSTQTHFPSAPPLWFPDPVGGLLALPLRPLGPVRVYNGVVFLQLWLSGLAAWGMARDLGAQPAGALLAGLFLSVSPFLLGLVHSGVTESLGLGPVVLYVWALLRATGRTPGEHKPKRWAFLWAGLALMLVGLQSPVYLAGGILLAGGCALGCFSLLPRRVATMAGIMAVAAGPMLLLRGVIQSTLGRGGVVSREMAPGWLPDGLPATDLLGFFQPGAHYFPDTPALGNPGVLHVHYLGWMALGLVVLGWRRAPWLRVPTVVLGILCLGPSLCVAGTHLPSLESPLLLPLSMIFMDGSPVDFIHHPYRLVGVLLPLLALLLAHGAGRLQARWIALVGAVMVAESLLISPVPWPLPATDAQAPSIYAQLPPGPVMDWPPDATDWNRRYLRWQASHGRATAYGVNTVFPDAARHDAVLWQSFFHLADSAALLQNRDTQGQPPKTTTQPRTLAQQGFSALVFHGEALSVRDRARTRRRLERAYGPAVAVDGETLGWVLGRTEAGESAGRHGRGEAGGEALEDR